MKVFTACLYTETNTFSAEPTRLDDFYSFYFSRGGKHNQPLHFLAKILDIYRKQCKKNGWQYIESICTGAQPAGAIVSEDYKNLKNMILTDLKNASPIDMILFNLHGGMVAKDCDDPEGDLLQHVREIVGLDIPVGVLLDPHTHLTDAMIEYSDITISAKEYSHTDFLECAQVLIDNLSLFMLGKIKPNQYVLDCQMIQLFPTTKEPMISFVNQMKKIELEHDAT